MSSNSAIAERWPSTRATLLVRLKDTQDRASWTTFVDVYLPAIYRYCRTRGLQDCDARDVSQDVLLQVSRAIRKFEYDPERGRFRGWLRTLMQRELWRHLKRRGKQTPQSHQLLGELPEGDPLEPEWIDEFNRQVLLTALQRVRHEFSDEIWRAFELAWCRSRSPKEIAEVMGCEPQRVYQAKFRVMRRLREEVEFLADDLAVLHR